MSGDGVPNDEEPSVWRPIWSHGRLHDPTPVRGGSARSHATTGGPPAASAADRFVLDSVEIASVLAEAAVQPFLARRSERYFRGNSFVHVRFHDAPTLASFRRTGSIRAIARSRTWRLVRRWAEAGGDGGLDEAMCFAVARYLNDDFPGLLEAQVFTWVEDR